MVPAPRRLPSKERMVGHCPAEPTQPGTLCTAQRAHPPRPTPATDRSGQRGTASPGLELLSLISQGAWA